MLVEKDKPTNHFVLLSVIVLKWLVVGESPKIVDGMN